MNAQYYLSKDSKTIGPCTLDDLRFFIAYGSVDEADLVRSDGDSSWMPLRQFRELRAQEDGLTSDAACLPRRTARYRDYANVPEKERAGWVLRRLIVGFFLFPPHLWQGAVALFQNRIYTRRADENGYLLTWPRKVEFVAGALLIVNSLAWWLTLLWITGHARPLVRELLMLFRTGMVDLQDWLGR